MFDRDEQHREVVRAHFVHYSQGRTEVWRAIRKILGQIVGRQNQNAEVHCALAELFLEMHNVAGDEIASNRNLNFDSNANLRSVYGLALHPIDVP